MSPTVPVRPQTLLRRYVVLPVLCLLLYWPFPSFGANLNDLLGENPPVELDLTSGFYNWNYRESAGDSDSAGMVPIRGRAIAYWKHLVYGADLGYMSTFGGTYRGALQNLSTGSTTPFTSPMTETMFQGAFHAGITWTGLNTRWDLWGSAGYHQQVWMTPGPEGYEEVYHIPYLGVTLYEQTPLSDRFLFFSEAGARSGISPSITIGLFNNPTLGLNGAVNVHGRIGGRYFFTPQWGISLDMAYSNWAFTHSSAATVPGTNPQIRIQEPDSTTTWWGPEAGIVFFF
ncbi:MAG: hypothetical protein M1297_06995 [Nitrospirae bacterium]|nr:hypothetical protein [Nitrospirota bacterium]